MDTTRLPEFEKHMAGGSGAVGAGSSAGSAGVGQLLHSVRFLIGFQKRLCPINCRLRFASALSPAEGQCV
ncbi:hypothetical protein AV530_011533 [Patagioenas fasciata monilis]|uniref:Uncharacterized protein n=1 Tax=Patagioenas fasciata monilis TaxID=372326 RepID=A0A1V4JVI7_PATFA|nr:hypothetical protein AV530_011533 [Patagioenas fasciata monilis]